MVEHERLRKTVQKRFLELKSRNPRYSVRAYARRVGISPSTLSLLLLGKRKVSLKMAKLIAANLGLDPQSRSEILYSNASDGSREGQEDPAHDYALLENDLFHLICDWQYFALLNLVELKNATHTVQHFADRLGLTENQTENALELLQRLGLLKFEDGRYHRIQKRYRTTDDIENLALRRSHHETLELAQDCLHKRAVEERDYTWITFSMKEKDLPRAKELIRKFQDDLLDEVEDAKEGDDVYRIAFQLFPLTRKSENEGHAIMNRRNRNESA